MSIDPINGSAVRLVGLGDPLVHSPALKSAVATGSRPRSRTEQLVLSGI